MNDQVLPQASRLRSRRAFLRQSSLLMLAASAGGSFSRQLFAAEEKTAAEAIAGKDARLIVHNATPGEIETPLELLRQHRLTPKELLFVRNNQTLPDAQTLEPQSLTDWKIEIAGLVDKPQTFDAKELPALEQVEHVIVLQCSGNGRAEFSKAAKAKGAQWQYGSMGNVQFSGVPVKALLKKLAVEPKGEARFVTAEGRDLPSKPGAADFEHSLPLADVLERSFIAWKMNGEPIPAVHGGPVRLITPGYYGTMNIKWLSRLRLERDETTNHHQSGRYRTPLEPIKPGSEFDYKLTNSEPNWRMRIKSAIFAPLEGEMMQAGMREVRGVAFNDGAVKIDAVHVSLNGGKTWHRAALETPKSPYAWYHWQANLDLPRGEQTILARAVDALGRTQPLEGAVNWNPAGYAWHGVHAVKVTVT